MQSDAENIDPRVPNTSTGKTMLLSKCTKCGGEKLRFTKNQEAKGLLSNLEIRTPLSKVLLLGDICFRSIKCMKYSISFY